MLGLRLLHPAAIAAVAIVAAACARSSETSGSTTSEVKDTSSPPVSGPQNVVVDKKGFVPNHITVAQGKPASLVFVRTTNETCADKVVFPSLKIEKDLPLNQPVTVDLPTGEAQTYTFQCGMGMYKSSVVVR